ncbi:MAG TPA: hypothetical protein VFU17_05650 [Candidatus Limnocylindrales bacterium]|nr:hypothetical protein [Candidatus Limnocylindrales bacterium]
MSTEPIVFWGPGSEWFWTMLQFAVVAVTLVGIYVQFRLQRAANAFDQLNRITAEMDSETMLRARLEVARAIAAGDALPDGGMALVANYWEKVASLVRGGHVDRAVLYESGGSGAPLWWAAVADAARDVRRSREDPTIWKQFEWLAKAFTAHAEKKKEPFAFDHDAVVRIFTAGIPVLEDRIRMLEESRLPPERTASPARRARRPI